MINIIKLPIKIPKKFIENKIKLFLIRKKFCPAKPNPITESGGTIVAEIAIPVIFSEIFGLA